MIEVLDAVDALTTPQRSRVPQDDPTHPAGVRFTRVTLPPLLTRLEDAITSTMSRGKGGTLASERNIIDPDALHRFVRISTAISDWATIADSGVVKGDPCVTLRRWYVAWSVKPREPSDIKWRVKQLHGWEREIQTKLDPPRVWDLPYPCPTCGATGWWNPREPTRSAFPRPLIIEYHPTGPDTIENAKGLCRACGTAYRVRELAYEIELTEAAVLTRHTAGVHHEVIAAELHLTVDAVAGYLDQSRARLTAAGQPADRAGLRRLAVTVRRHDNSGDEDAWKI